MPTSFGNDPESGLGGGYDRAKTSGGAIVLMGDERAQGTGATDEAESRAGA